MLTRARGAGFAYRAAFETEFFLLRPDGTGHVPFDLSPALSSRAMDAAAGVTAAIVDALVDQGVPVEFYGAEAGRGQHELVVRFDDALRAADLQLVVREATRAVAANRGLLASFAPSPWLTTWEAVAMCTAVCGASEAEPISFTLRASRRGCRGSPGGLSVASFTTCRPWSR